MRDLHGETPGHVPGKTPLAAVGSRHIVLHAATLLQLQFYMHACIYDAQISPETLKMPLPLIQVLKRHMNVLRSSSTSRSASLKQSWYSDTWASNTHLFRS